MQALDSASSIGSIRQPKKPKMDRATYSQRSSELAIRGVGLPQTKLTDDDIRRIRIMADRREKLRAIITDRYSNKSIAEIFGVHRRTIEKVLQHHTHINV